MVRCEQTVEVKFPLNVTINPDKLREMLTSVTGGSVKDISRDGRTFGIGCNAVLFEGRDVGPTCVVDALKTLSYRVEDCERCLKNPPVASQTPATP